MERLATVIGAGGKTTLINYLAEQYARQGKKVLVTTTTKMYILPDTHLFQRCDEIISFLKDIRNGIVITAGIPCGSGKFSSLCGQWLANIQGYVDIILVEGDGSKSLSLKLPGEGEPVIPSKCNTLYIVGGARAIGRKINQVCHRMELVSKFLAKDPSDIVEAEDYCKVLAEYENIVREKYNIENIFTVVSQIDAVENEQSIDKCFSSMDKANVLYFERVAEDEYVLRDCKAYK